METTLKLAIDDPVLGPEIRKTRIATPDERTENDRIKRIREKMETAGAFDPATPKGKKNRARLELAMESMSKIFDLEREWLSDEERFQMGVWLAEKGPFIIHDEAVLVARFVLNTYRPDIARYQIAVVMQEGIPPVNRRERLGTAAKLPGKLKFLSDKDAVITLDHGHWTMLTDQDRQRLIHHELRHLQDNDKRTALCLRTHDFEDFADVIELYGLRSESERFSTDGRSAEVLEHWGAQLELLERAS